MIVEDSMLVAERLIVMMQGLNAVSLINHAGTYAEASARLSKTRPNFVLLDINLPDGSGIVLLPEIKKYYPETKVIMLTNQANDYYENYCKQRGADYFLDKSKDFELIPAIIFPEVFGPDFKNITVYN